jgi:multidrug efflux pump subunit AcrA (membrane-fusion protein)
MSAALKTFPDPPPHELLRLAIAERDAITARMASATKRRDEAEEAEQQASRSLADLDAREAASWAAWAENQTLAKPGDGRQRRAELTALHTAAARAAAAAQSAYVVAEAAWMQDSPISQRAIADAVSAVLIDHAAGLGRVYLEHVKAARRAEAALAGIRAGFVKAGDGFNAGVVAGFITGGNPTDAWNRRAELTCVCAKLTEAWAGLGDRLRNGDADAVEELT